jgi:iron complex transport system substrate-binding protein
LAFARGSERIFRVLAAAGLVLAAATPLRAEAPGRVVSMNLCTDQLALMLAREGQLISVSDIARDP